MPQSLHKVTLHMVFSTKERVPLIDAETHPLLHAFMATVYRDIAPPQSQAYRTGGTRKSIIRR